jgi:hypothetical protein
MNRIWMDLHSLLLSMLLFCNHGVFLLFYHWLLIVTKFKGGSDTMWMEIAIVAAVSSGETADVADD